MSAQLLSKSSFKDKNSIRLEKWAQVFSLKRKSSSQWISTSTAEGLVLKELDEFTLRILPDKCEKNENDCVRNPLFVMIWKMLFKRQSIKILIKQIKCVKILI